MKPVLALRTTLLAFAISFSLAGCDDSSEMSQEEIQYLSHLDQSHFFQRQGELKASTLEARSAIEMQPERVEPYLVIINNLLTAGDARSAERQLDGLMNTIDKTTISQSSNNDAALVRAEANLMQGQFTEAVAALETLTGADRAQQLEATLLTGHALLASGDHDAARNAYETAQGLDSTSVEPLIGLSRVAFVENQPENVAAFIKQANDIDSQHVELWLWKARVAHSKERWAEAEQAYISALETIGQYDIMTFRKFETMSALIDVLRQQGKSAEAFVYEEILAKSAPGTIRSNLIAAQEAFNSGDLNSAARYLEETLTQAPGNEKAATMLGIIRFRQGRVEEAEKLLAPVAALNESEQVSKLLAATKLQLRDPEGAKEILAEIEGQESDPGTLALVGVASLASGDTEGGEQLIEKALELDPENNSLRLRYASYHLQQGNPERTIALTREAFAKDATSAAAHEMLIRAQLASDDMEAAKKSASEWVEREPESIFALIMRGNVAQLSKALDQAAGFYQKAADAEPTSALPLIALANLERRRDNTDNAKKLFTKAVRLAPENRQALQGLTSMMDRKNIMPLMEDILENQPNAVGPQLMLLELALIDGNSTRASELTASLMERESPEAQAPAEAQVARAYDGIATQMLRRGRSEEAADILQRGRVLFPKHENIGLQAAALQFNQGNTSTAREILSEVKQAHPDSPSPFLVEAGYFEQQNEHDQAAELYQLALDKEPSAMAQLGYARALTAAGRVAKATESLETARQINPGNTDILMSLATAYQGNKRQSEAAAVYEQIIEVQPKNAVALNNLAWIYHEQKNNDALKIARRAYEISPDTAAIADTYGWILLNNGQEADSVAILEKAHQLAPESAEIATHLADAYKATGNDEKAQSILEKL